MPCHAATAPLIACSAITPDFHATPAATPTLMLMPLRRYAPLAPLLMRDRRCRFAFIACADGHYDTPLLRCQILPLFRFCRRAMRAPPLRHFALKDAISYYYFRHAMIMPLIFIIFPIAAIISLLPLPPLFSCCAADAARCRHAAMPLRCHYCHFRFSLFTHIIPAAMPCHCHTPYAAMPCQRPPLLPAPCRRRHAITPLFSPCRHYFR